MSEALSKNSKLQYLQVKFFGSAEWDFMWIWRYFGVRKPLLQTGQYSFFTRSLPSASLLCCESLCFLRCSFLTNRFWQTSHSKAGRIFVRIFLGNLRDLLTFCVRMVDHVQVQVIGSCESFLANFTLKCQKLIKDPKKATQDSPGMA